MYDDSIEYIVELKSQSKDDVSYGTAVMLEDDIFVTNAHLITYKKGGIYVLFDNVYIRFSFEEEYREVTILKYDINKDLAFIKLIECIDKNIKTAKINTQTKINYGDKVYAVGNALNHGISISEGVISIPYLNIEYNGIVRKVIQCDITINDGNSGGALLDKYGNLIGIITFRLKDNLGNTIYGLAYCIPINETLEFYRNL